MLGKKSDGATGSWLRQPARVRRSTSSWSRNPAACNMRRCSSRPACAPATPTSGPGCSSPNRCPARAGPSDPRITDLPTARGCSNRARRHLPALRVAPFRRRLSLWQQDRGALRPARGRALPLLRHRHADHRPARLGALRLRPPQRLAAARGDLAHDRAYTAPATARSGNRSTTASGWSLKARSTSRSPMNSGSATSISTRAGSSTAARANSGNASSITRWKSATTRRRR